MCGGCLKVFWVCGRAISGAFCSNCRSKLVENQWQALQNYTGLTAPQAVACIGSQGERAQWYMVYQSLRALRIIAVCVKTEIVAFECGRLVKIPHQHQVASYKWSAERRYWEWKKAQ